MQFTTPCFVRVENPQERKELTEWLESIGWLRASDIEYVGLDKGIACLCGGTHYDLWSDAIEYFPAGTIYDCGTNIALFKALAAMNDENDREQWFVCIKSHACGCDDDGEHYHVCELSRFWDNRTPPANLWRKATAEEIINHFKNQKS